MLFGEFEHPTSQDLECRRPTDAEGVGEIFQVRAPRLGEIADPVRDLEDPFLSGCQISRTPVPTNAHDLRKAAEVVPRPAEGARRGFGMGKKNSPGRVLAFVIVTKERATRTNSTGLEYRSTYGREGSRSPHEDTVPANSTEGDPIRPGAVAKELFNLRNRG
jgi:hypothetical protein